MNPSLLNTLILRANHSTSPNFKHACAIVCGHKIKVISHNDIDKTMNTNFNRNTMHAECGALWRLLCKTTKDK
jgi:hypothetical protein